MKKILAHVVHKSHPVPTTALFTESITNLFHEEDDDDYEAKVNCSLTDNCFLLAPSAGRTCCVLRRATFCPIYHLREDDIAQLSQDTKTRGVDVAVCTLLESSDNFVLLTRRSSAMRTFPGVWVPPGGHIELNETLEEAGKRELLEETGLSIQSERAAAVLGLWESAFPPRLTWGGLPTRHHIVTHLVIKDIRAAREINERMELQPDEVDCCGWVCPQLAWKIVQSDPQFSLRSGLCRPTCHIENCTMDCSSLSKQKMMGSYLNNGSTVTGKVAIAPLLNQYSRDDSGGERVSTGTKFALKMWLEHQL